jgi:hypothetical protein
MPSTLNKSHMQQMQMWILIIKIRAIVQCSALKDGCPDTKVYKINHLENELL